MHIILALGSLIFVAVGMFNGWVFLLDHVNLAIHEAGHPIFGIISPALMVYGGTIFQICFPIFFIFHFKKEQHINGILFANVWLSTSIHNMAIYMKDARALQLPLVGGLDPEQFHDWAEIFSRFGILKYDTSIGTFFIFLSWCYLIYSYYYWFSNLKKEENQ